MNTLTLAPSDQQLMAEHFAQFVHDPLGAVLYGFPWGEGELRGVEGPRVWQREVLEYVGSWFTDPATRHKPCRIAISSGHGPGKSALASFLTWWGMSTFPDCRVNITANTKGQLDTKTQPEMAHWFKLARNSSWWDVHVTSIKQNETKGDAGWRADFVPWSEDNAQAVAGLHNARKRIILVMDEASEIADIIRDTAQGAFTDADTEMLWLALGNPTRNVGWFYDAVFGDPKQRQRWKSWVIDSRDVEGTNKEELAEWLAECDGDEDADYFRVRARGLPPRAASGQFIDSERINQAQKRIVRVLADEPLVAGVDFAWGGEDDNVVRFRRGLDARSIKPIRVKGEFTRDPAVMTQKLADVLTASYDGHKVAMMFCDSAGIAGPVVARLRALGHRNIMEVNFGQDSPDAHYAYMRDFMWGKMRDFLLTGAIDNFPGLEADLSGPLAVSNLKQQVKLESKELMKKRLKKLGKSGDSPDDADALALTFAMPVVPREADKPREQIHLGRDEGQSWMG